MTYIITVQVMYHTSTVLLPGAPPWLEFLLRGPTFWNTGNMYWVIQWSLWPNGLTENLRLALLKADGKRSLYSILDTAIPQQADGTLVNTMPAKTFVLPGGSKVCRKSCTIVNSLENATASTTNTYKHLLCTLHSTQINASKMNN